MLLISNKNVYINTRSMYSIQIRKESYIRTKSETVPKFTIKLKVYKEYFQITFKFKTLHSYE